MIQLYRIKCCFLRIYIHLCVLHMFVINVSIVDCNKLFNATPSPKRNQTFMHFKSSLNNSKRCDVISIFVQDFWVNFKIFKTINVYICRWHESGPIYAYLLKLFIFMLPCTLKYINIQSYSSFNIFLFVAEFERQRRVTEKTFTQTFVCILSNYI